jgi:hypothetical protein
LTGELTVELRAVELTAEVTAEVTAAELIEVRGLAQIISRQREKRAKKVKTKVKWLSGILMFVA